MSLRYVLSATGLGLAALVLAGLAVRTVIRARGGAPIAEPGLLAASRFCAAAGCALLGASYLVANWRTGLFLLVPAVGALAYSIVLESRRQRRNAGH